MTDADYIYHNPDLDENNNDLLFDFDKIMTDPEEGRRAIEAVRRGTMAKNTITLDEFQEFKALFMDDARTVMGTRSYDQTCANYKTRVSIFHPVRIVTNDRTELLLTLPPIFNRPVPVNVLGEIGPQMVMALHNACGNRIDTFDHKKKQYAKVTADLYATAQELVRAQNVKETEDILRNFKKPNNESVDEQPNFSEGEVEIL